MVPDDVLDDVDLNLVVAVDEDVPKARHFREPGGQLFGDGARPGEEAKKRPVCFRLPEPLVGDNMGGDVERLLNRDLQSALDKALLAHIDAKPLGSGQGPQLVQAGRDSRELLRNEVAVGHRIAASR